ncbi:amino acid deaminase [Epidermidibacterium keratini]|uniref:Amino acid deaminase n=1 Tax=Epidermidibacterium keratini TaxID=1891644 RepID=A0A7L4YK33_9ACTN|nr:alanine racemase [Epidermidibacterium keratini]QHB99620.1 amino acid deaminase [Epidermidibacterium keratini]
MIDDPKDVAVLDDGPIGLRFKGLPPDAAELTLAEFGNERRPLFRGGFTWPLMTLRRNAIEHNATLLAGFAQAHGLALAPHLKTSMSPLLAEVALRRGAWGVTVAMPHQARVFMALGVDRILVANEVLDGEFLAEVGGWTASAPDRRLLCLVDSVAGAELMDRSATAPLEVLVDIGHAGGRTGVRDVETFDAVVQAVADSARLRLRGVSCYEGSVSHSREEAELAKVRSFLQVVRDRADQVADRVDGSMIVSAGGSIYFDCVSEVLSPSAFGSCDVVTILRSGAYLTHDDGLYAAISPLGEAVAEQRRLLPAIRVWAQVLSRPEPGLVIVGAGRRDLNEDSGLPQPVEVRDRAGEAPRSTGSWRVTTLNDQHAFCEVPTADPVAPGDLVAFAISHPCTAHDRWTAPVVIDDNHQVVAVARSYF